ncbi:MAG: hypothetical protein H6993_01655 [Pseudomonadales bacterium]|nr:hypothetical protein [Pseudomonadales bacterium]MCP5182632.1 hypothetical protein [Pseudomonadales bacterium]
MKRVAAILLLIPLLSVGLGGLLMWLADRYPDPDVMTTTVPLSKTNQ